MMVGINKIPLAELEISEQKIIHDLLGATINNTVRWKQSSFDYRASQADIELSFSDSLDDMYVELKFPSEDTIRVLLPADFGLEEAIENAKFHHNKKDISRLSLELTLLNMEKQLEKNTD